MSAIDELEKEEWEFKRYERWQHTASFFAFITNMFRDKNSKLANWEDFMPVSLPGIAKSAHLKRPKHTWQEVYAEIKTINDNYKKGR
ncbi:MAG: hypothetical protein PHU36_08635 [Syntrophomonadaceae bacterium]|nr:hypothetical protein [Syntrophomonadaceae bacterium]